MIEPTTVFWLGAVGMGVGTAAFAWGGRSAANAHRRYYAILGSISLIAMVAYATMAMKIGWIDVGGRMVFAPRYIDWILTTPLLLLFLGLLAGSSRRELGFVIGANTVVMGLGFAAALLAGTGRFVLFGVASVAYVGVLYALLGPMTARANARGAGIRSLFTSLRNLTVVLWTVYPLVWLLGQAGFALLTLSVDVMLLTYLDLLTKVGFGLIALNAGTIIETELGASLAAAPDIDATPGAD